MTVDPTPGPRDELITRAVERALADLDPNQLVQEPLDPAEAPDRLSRHLARAVAAALREFNDAPNDDNAADMGAQHVGHINPLLADPDEHVVLPPRVLKEIRSFAATGGGLNPPVRLPKTPLGRSDLLVNATDQPTIGSELRAELETATHVDLLCAFVIMSGVTKLEDQLRRLVDRGGKLRVITTTYMGATERAAVDRFVDIGATVKVALDAQTTKLHAKAWLLTRPSGLTTAFIGSSNLSHTALFDGLEWNVRLSEADASHVIERVRSMFDAHWESEYFEDYDPRKRPDDRDRLDRALRTSDNRRLGQSGTFVGLEVTAQPHQQRMLDELDVARHRHGHHRNLVVSATGTGKTVLAALDYRRLCASLGDGARPPLLFVAHRHEILNQALGTYRAVLGDGNFGELHVGGSRASGQHVFASIQTLSAQSQLPDADEFDVVVVDEFHHAAATTYRRLLDRLEPKELLGLTATPERADGEAVQDLFFDARIATELRLWEAIDEGFLAPFQYFGVGDEVDLSNVTWRRGEYDSGELEQIYTADDARVKAVLRELTRVLPDPGSMRALGFCVSVRHAEFMAARFNHFGFAAAALSGQDAPEERQRVLGELKAGRLRCVFSVDVLGEGVDVPAVDTVLLLRPTQSPVVFAQQVGRGLRRHEGKSHLTVVDLIGQQRREFRIDRRFGVLVDRRRGTVQRQVEDDFAFLPAGCSIVLDRKSREVVLGQLKTIAKSGGVARMADDLKYLDASVDLGGFLAATGRELDDVYAGAASSWTRVRRAAGRAVQLGPDEAVEASLLKSVRRLRHIDDPERCDTYRRWLQLSNAPEVGVLSERERRLLRMLIWSVWGRNSPADDLSGAAAALWRYPAVTSELAELFTVTDVIASRDARPAGLASQVPLLTHARYATAEVIAALRPDADAPVKAVIPQTGVHYERAANADVFFVTLKKSERDYSPTTLYRDYALTRELFHWESQSVQHQELATVQRYIRHREMNSEVLMFVREAKTDDIGATRPFTFLGPVDYVQHSGDRPVQFTWKLRRPMPEELFEVARAVAVA